MLRPAAPVGLAQPSSPLHEPGADELCLSNASVTGTAHLDVASDFARLLFQARGGANEPLGQLLQLYRNYLTILATTQIDRKVRTRVSPSDIVQEAMLMAHRDFAQYRGRTEREFLAWLRQILIHTLHRIVTAHVRVKSRTVRREISLEAMGERFDRSAANFLSALVDPGPSPSAPARERESVVMLADQLAQLPAHYRDVIVLRNLQGLPFEEIAQRLGKSAGGVRMTWLRAMEQFKQIRQSQES